MRREKKAYYVKVDYRLVHWFDTKKNLICTKLFAADDPLTELEGYELVECESKDQVRNLAMKDLTGVAATPLLQVR